MVEQVSLSAWLCPGTLVMVTDKLTGPVTSVMEPSVKVLHNVELITTSIKSNKHQN